MPHCLNSCGQLHIFRLITLQCLQLSTRWRKRHLATLISCSVQWCVRTKSRVVVLYLPLEAPSKGPRKVTKGWCKNVVWGHCSVNHLLLCRLYGESGPLESISSFLSPKRIPFTEASKQTFVPYKLGDTFGPTSVIQSVFSVIHVCWSRTLWPLIECILLKGGGPVGLNWLWKSQKPGEEKRFIFSGKVMEKQWFGEMNSQFR